MENFQLSLFLSIPGVGAASGLVYHQDCIYLISDKSNYLYQYMLMAARLNKIVVNNKPQENIAKHIKPDFETLTLHQNSLVFMSSGATPKRGLLGTFDLANNQYDVSDIYPLFLHIKTQLAISDKDFNIEGVILTNAGMLFFQRGNGPSGTNGVIYTEDSNASVDLPPVTFTPIQLPKINGVTATFTDAILVKDKIYFLATAEDVASTYQDGKVMGSLLGVLDATTYALEQHIVISEKHKFEGITLYNQSLNEIEFLLCEDNDSEEMVSQIYKLVLSF